LQVVALGGLCRTGAAHVRQALHGAAALREAGTDEQAAALSGRLPAAGMFRLCLKGVSDQFRFGTGS
jgi:hypothetical protein